MTVVVTGATGFVGSHITRHLLKAGYTVTAIARDPASSWLAHCHHPELRVLSSSLESLDALPGETSAIVHAAATSPVSGIGVAEFVRDNALATERLCALAQAHPVRHFVYLSSLSVYGRIDEPVVGEQTSLRDACAYGLTKRLGELSLEERSATLPALALRLPGVLGRGAARHWLAGLVLRGRAGHEIEIFNPEAPFNNAAHVHDIACLIESVLGRPLRGFDAVNLGAADTLTIEAVARRVASAFGDRSKVSVVPPRAAPFTIDSTRAAERYGYAPMPMCPMLDRYLDEAREG